MCACDCFYLFIVLISLGCLIAYVVLYIITDKTVNTLPIGGTVMSGIPHLPDASKLVRQQKLTIDGKEVLKSVPWRTGEVHIAENVEIQWMLGNPKLPTLDCTAGTCSGALAAMRLNRSCVLIEKDGTILADAIARMKFFLQHRLDEHGYCQHGTARDCM